MKGTVADINWKRGMVAVLTSDSGYSTFELLGDDEIEIGDEVWWRDDTALGGETIKNITKGVRLEVYFQNHWVHKSNLRKQLLYA